jgi:DNA-directed RNA polymerase II subunit RPB2
MVEADGAAEQLVPNMARLRNLTYCAPLFVDVERKRWIIDDTGKEIEPDGPNDQAAVTERVFIGRVPIMLKSTYCLLTTHREEKELAELGECPYDQGGYFIINGSEKVLIAQERMSSNHCYCFRSKKDQYVAEIRSMKEGTTRPTSSLYVKLVKPTKGGAISGQVLRVSIPYIRQDIPIIVSHPPPDIEYSYL